MIFKRRGTFRDRSEGKKVGRQITLKKGGGKQLDMALEESDEFEDDEMASHNKKIE